MSRSPGGFAISDIRSALILQEYTHLTNPCAPGATIRQNCRDLKILDCGIPPCGFDRPKDFISVIAAMVVVATVIGLLHSFALFIPVIQKEYEMGFVEVCFTAAITYAVVIKTACLGCLCIRWVGHRLTAIFGMLLIFIGLLLDSQALHFAAFYVANILFFGVGGGLAYTSAMCVSGDLFRKNLLNGMVLVAIAGRLGTIIFYWFIIFLMSHISYKWTKLCLAVLVLIFMGATNVLPSFQVDIGCLDVTTSSDRDQEIKACVDQAARRDKSRNPAKHEGEKACLCVCVCDISLWSDWSFLLWAVCVFLATMALYVPYMYIVAYADTIAVELSPWYITALCIASMLGRVIILMGNDHTYSYNRIVFQGTVVFSGVLWLILGWAETYGWILVWCVVMGVIEGAIVCVIPRMTICTIPRQWLEHSWGWIMWFHAIGVFVMTVFVAVVARELLDFYVAFITIGILQIMCGILAFLLPNEEECNSGTGGLSNNPCGESVSISIPPRPNFYTAGTYSNYVSSSLAAGYSGFKSNLTAVTARPASTGNYKGGCPICYRIGCFPECSGCVPGGLSSGGLEPCNPSLNTDAVGGTGLSGSAGASNNTPEASDTSNNTPGASGTSKAPGASGTSKAPGASGTSKAPGASSNNTPGSSSGGPPALKSASSPTSEGIVKRTTVEVRRTVKTPVGGK